MTMGATPAVAPDANARAGSGGRKNFKWTPERLEFLRAEWLANTSPLAIGQLLGITKSAVSAKANVLGLPDRRTDPEVRARMSEARKKAWADPEVRARMSEARKKAWADPEVRARMSEARKKAWADPEVRARKSRSWARKAVRTAGLPMLKQHVDRAIALRAQGHDMETCVDALLRDQSAAAA
ncbi:hypothetical protein [Vitreimonas flagellata]|uniref:hypothetical protein n=1 Tax=Vitreimonas flagellata TaxID=2560861 RepID=UPI0010758094|nr:hypothetical protein [Vitreimonas flagellata]